MKYWIYKNLEISLNKIQKKNNIINIIAILINLKLKPPKMDTS